MFSISKLENSLATLMWDSFSNDCSFLDIFTDRYKTEDGIDKDNSIYNYNATDYYIYQPLISGLLLETVQWESVTTNPTSAYSLIEFSTIYNLINATEFTVNISLDGGNTFTQITNQNLYKQEDNKYYFKGLISGLSGGNQIKAKIICDSTITDMKIYAFALGVK
jgi:hypothetical protein